eukprot:31347-Pelagococcus_subviridis.AAC.11
MSQDIPNDGILLLPRAPLCRPALSSLKVMVGLQKRTFVRAVAARIDLKLRHDDVHYKADALTKFREFWRPGRRF